jgi:hypothetical protein
MRIRERAKKFWRSAPEMPSWRSGLIQVTVTADHDLTDCLRIR